ncbi:MAG: hypothetical protein K2I75_00830, partial [Clostridiales bacterium]|nr:hypothetical protein [Clostridiales bacterium]
MNAYDKSVLKAALGVAAVITVLYAVVIIIIAQTNVYVYYALFGVPAIFALTSSFYYTLKQGMIKFATPDVIYTWYDNPVDNYHRSEASKRWGSLIL